MSPGFELSFNGVENPFKILLYPNPTSEAKGGASFKRANGKGYMQLKCEADPKDCFGVTFRFFVGGKEKPRGPVTHDFRTSGAIAALPSGTATWSLKDGVDL